QGGRGGWGRPCPSRGAPITVMDKYRPKRPTSLNLFPQLPQAGTQQSRLNSANSGKKHVWTGDPAPQDAKPKPEDKVRPAAQRRPAPKPPTAGTSNSRNNAQAAASAADARVRPRERSTSTATQPCSTLRGNGTDRRGGRLCEDKAKDKDSQEVYLPAMVVPRTPVATRSQEKGQNQEKSQNQNRPARTSTDKDKPEADRTAAKTGAGGDKAEDTMDIKLDRTRPKSEAASGLSFASVKYTLVVDKHAQLELGQLKDCLHGPNEHNEDSDAETVYQSAKMEEDRKGQTQNLVEHQNFARVCKQSKVSSATTSEEDESNGGGRGPRSRKFLNLFTANSSSPYSATGASLFGVFSCVLDGVERQQSHRAVYRFVPRHADELQLETDDPVLMLKQSEDLWCQGYNMRTGATGIFPAFYAVRVPKDGSHDIKFRNDGWTEQFVVRFLGSVQVPIHMGNDVLCAAMQKVVCNRRSAGQLPSACVLEVSVKGVKMIVQDQCHSVHRGDQCFHFFQLKNISFCGCHPKHSRYFGFITKHPDQQRFACHVLMSDTTLHPLAESVRRAFQQFYKEHVGYSCPTEDIFIE
uniref:Mitogen-activated protein kinase 8 interacting protein 1a n=1 Tax=Poecilia formosa TaxID=48698 RepID=A0A087YAX2_POEFO